MKAERITELIQLMHGTARRAADCNGGDGCTAWSRRALRGASARIDYPMEDESRSSRDVRHVIDTLVKLVEQTDEYPGYDRAALRCLWGQD